MPFDANQQLPARLGVNSESVIHMASTFACLTGVPNGVRLPTQVAATAVYEDAWNNERFVEPIERHPITYSKIIERDEYACSGIRWRVVGAGGSEVPADQGGMLQVTGPVTVAGGKIQKYRLRAAIAGAS